MRRLLISVALLTTVLVVFHSADWLQTSSISAVRMSMRNRHQLHYTPPNTAAAANRLADQPRSRNVAEPDVAALASTTAASGTEFME